MNFDENYYAHLELEEEAIALAVEGLQDLAEDEADRMGDEGTYQAERETEYAEQQYAPSEGLSYL